MSYNFQTYLKDDITIESRSTTSVDDRGLYTDSWSTLSTTKGRIESVRSQEQEDNSEMLINEFDLYIPASVSIKTSHRINISSSYYEVLGIFDYKNRHGNLVLKRLRLRRTS